MSAETGRHKTGNWTAYESAAFKGEWGVQSDDPALIASGDEIILYPSVPENFARLIAAAPEMLEALQMSVPALEWCQKQWAKSPQAGEGVNVLAIVRAAIAKAVQS